MQCLYFGLYGAVIKQVNHCVSRCFEWFA